MSTTSGNWTATALAAAALLAAAVIALIPQVSTVAPVALAAVGALAGAVVLAPQALAAVRRHHGLVLVAGLVALAGLWVAAGISHANGVGPTPFTGSGPFHSGQPYPFVEFAYSVFGAPSGSSGWPWRLGRLPLGLLALTLLAATVGLVLLSDSVRVQVGLAPNRWVPWRVMTAPVQRRAQIAGRAIPGALLIGGAAFAGIGLANRYTSGDSLLESVIAIVIGGWAAVLISSPLLVGALTMVDRDKAGLAREEERQRFAAHLHDSVLQTLALVQRQAHDPAAVARLARRQEHALRAWMAGESELLSDTLAAALRDAVASVEDEYGITIELTAIGDRALDDKGEALVAAAREALRNSARHAAGAPVFVFCDITSSKVELFVRDEGPGFDPDAVAAERRGIRDAVIGRMESVGGLATIESKSGEGTEVALKLGLNGAAR